MPEHGRKLDLNSGLCKQIPPSGDLLASLVLPGSLPFGRYASWQHPPGQLQPKSRARERVDGAYRVVRISDHGVAGVVALAGDGSYGKPSTKPFRQIVNTFRTSKVKE